jgi:LPXTG-site transpeptidase (sortase) family protein
MLTGGAVRRVAGLAVLAAGLAGCSASAGGAPAGPATGAPTPVTSAIADGYKSSRALAKVALPVRVRVPGIGVNSVLEHLGKAGNGTIELPTKPTDAGWYDQGPRPGERGPAVIIGHVDWDHGPAVFFRLRELKPGDEVDVDRADGSTAKFAVTKTEQIPKTDFPTELVYAPSLETSLRLVTCGGSFNHAVHSYRDNVIVYAAPK